MTVPSTRAFDVDVDVDAGAAWGGGVGGVGDLGAGDERLGASFVESVSSEHILAGAFFLFLPETTPTPRFFFFFGAISSACAFALFTL
jgi:hypothetical protein